MTLTLSPTAPWDQPACCPVPGSSPLTPTGQNNALADQDLLSRLLGGLVKDPDTVAASLLGHFGTLGALFSADFTELGRAVGTGLAVFEQLNLLRELAVRFARNEACRRPAIASWTALLAYVRTAMAHRPREQFRVLYLDRRNYLMRDELQSEGTVHHAPVYPREVVRRALEVSASAMILVHNHPSGDPSPSRSDIDMTRRIVEAARVFDIPVHDHLIVAGEGTASLKSLGLM